MKINNIRLNMPFVDDMQRELNKTVEHHTEYNDLRNRVGKELFQRVHLNIKDSITDALTYIY